MLRKRLLKIAIIVACFVLIISLVANIVYIRRLNKQHQREHQFTHLLYNQLIFDVYMSAGFPNSTFPGFPRASVNAAYAASVLNDLYIQASRTDNQKSIQVIEQDASFVSYLSLALVGQNAQYLTGSDHQTVTTITPDQAKNLLIRMREVISKNMVNGNDIPDDKIDTVYSEIHNLIPADFKSLDGVFDFFKH